MPIYEYACPDCGKKFDELQKFDDPPVTTCPGCQGGNVKKLISATSFVLKGGGWYADHYGLKKGGGESSTGPAPTATPAAASTPASAPAAPAAAPASTPSSTSSTPSST